MDNTTPGRSRLWDTLVDFNAMRGLLSPAYYAIGQSCPTCGAPAWQRCTLRGKPAGNREGHARRLDKGHKLYYHDLGKAPWAEERVDDTLYTSLSFEGLTAEQHAALELPPLDPKRLHVVKPGKGQPQLSRTEADARFKAGL